MPRVLITGAAGFIGMHTSIRFLEGGWDVVGLDNMNNYYSVTLKRDRLSEISKTASKLRRKFDMYEADLNSSIWKKFETLEFDTIIHLAAQAGVRYSIENPSAYLHANVLGFQKLLDFLVEKKVKRFMYASSSSVYGNSVKKCLSEEDPCNQPESYYAATKKANEMMAYSYYRTHGIYSVGMRFFTVYGPWGRPDMAPWLFTEAGVNNKKIQVFNYGRQTRDFTYIADIVEKIFVINSSFENTIQDAIILNLGNGSPEELGTFISEIEQSLDLKLEKELVGAHVGDVSHTYASTRRFSEIFGESGRSTSLKEGIKRFVEWYKDYNGILQ